MGHYTVLAVLEAKTEKGAIRKLRAYMRKIRKAERILFDYYRVYKPKHGDVLVHAGISFIGDIVSQGVCEEYAVHLNQNLFDRIVADWILKLGIEMDGFYLHDLIKDRAKLLRHDAIDETEDMAEFLEKEARKLEKSIAKIPNFKLYREKVTVFENGKVLKGLVHLINFTNKEFDNLIESRRIWVVAMDFHL